MDQVSTEPWSEAVAGGPDVKIRMIRECGSRAVRATEAVLADGGLLGEPRARTGLYVASMWPTVTVEWPAEDPDTEPLASIGPLWGQHWPLSDQTRAYGQNEADSGPGLGIFWPLKGHEGATGCAVAQRGCSLASHWPLRGL